MFFTRVVFLAQTLDHLCIGRILFLYPALFFKYWLKFILGDAETDSCITVKFFFFMIGIEFLRIAFSGGMV